MKQKPKGDYKKIIKIAGPFALIASGYWLMTGIVFAQNFLGPRSSAGVGQGAISVDTAYNLSIGTSTTQSDTKLLIIGTSTASASGYFAIKVLDAARGPLFVVRSDGSVSIGSQQIYGTSSATTTIPGTGNVPANGALFVNGPVFAQGPITTNGSLFAGNYAGTIGAGNISAAQFGSNTGGGNYSFPASLSVGTSTAPTAGVAYFNGNVGIGTAGPVTKLDVRGSSASIPSLGSHSEIFSILRTDGLIGLNAGIDSATNNFWIQSQNFSSPVAQALILQPIGGNVGIGTASPVAKLQIGATGATAPNGGYSHMIAGGLSFLFRDNYDSYIGGNTYYSSSGGWRRIYASGSSRIQLINEALYFETAPSGAADTSNDSSWTTGLVVKAGNVGIGTTNPTSTLTVAGAIKSTSGGFIFPDGTTQTTAGGGASTQWTTSGSDIYYNTGKVGIGNTSPTYRLDLSNNANDDTYQQFIRFGASNGAPTDSGGIMWKPAYGGYTKISAQIIATAEGNYFRNGLAFYTNGASDTTTTAVERMRIDMNGNVGIGTTGPIVSNYGGTFKVLAVNGGTGYGVLQGESSATASGSGIAAFNGLTSGASGFKIAAGIYIDLDGTSTGNASGRLNFYTADGAGGYLNRMTIDHSGTVNIPGTLTAGTVSGSYSGTINAGNVSAGTFGSNTGNGGFTFPASVYMLTRNWFYSENGSGVYDWAFGADPSSGYGGAGNFNLLTYNGGWNTSMVVQRTTGNVGIGTTAPASKFDVSGGDLQVETGQGRFKGWYTAGSGQAAELGISGTTVYLYNGQRTPSFSEAGDIQIGGAVAGGLTVKQTTGNVGIGTTGPTATLQVGSNSTGQSSGDNSTIARFGGSSAGGKVYAATMTNSAAATVNNESLLSFALASNWSATGAIGSRITNTTTADSDLVFYSYSSGLNQRMVIQANGYVGIGTTSPLGHLHVALPADGSAGLLVNDASGYGIYTGAQSTMNFNYGRNETSLGYINYFGYANGSSQFRSLEIDDGKAGLIGYFDGPNHRLGIGTRSPASALDIQLGAANYLNITGGPGIGSWVRLVPQNSGSEIWQAGGNNLGYSIYNETDGQYRMTVDNNGNVGIGTTTPGSGYKLDVNGVINTASNISAQGGTYITHLPWWNAGGAPTGYIKLVTPIVYNESNMFSIRIRGYSYNEGGKVIDVTCGGYAYTASGLISKYCQSLGNSTIPVEIDTENRGGTIYVVIRFGTPTSGWYYNHFTADYVGWQGKAASGFTWVTGETTPAQTGNTHNVIIDDSAGTITTTQPITVGTPTASGHAATKNYVDSVVTAGTTVASFAATALNGNLNMNGYNITAVNKLTVTTIDPVYTIGGVKYATYGADTIGLKVEAYGKAELTKSEISNSGKLNFPREVQLPDIGTTEYSYVIDFNKVEKGSDTWLFWQTINEGTNMEDIVVILTPEFDGRVWYELRPKQKQIVIFGEPSASNYGSSTPIVVVSYHLTAPRHDSDKFGNLLIDSTEKGTILKVRQ